MTEKDIKPVDDSKIEEIKKAIFSSSYATEFAKKALVWMLERSKNLTKQVSLSFPKKHSKLGRQVAYGIHDACGSSGGSKINDLLKKIGTPMFFSSHGGHYVDDEFNARTRGFTGWLAVEFYSDEAEKLPLNIAKIKTIKLE